MFQYYIQTAEHIVKILLLFVSSFIPVFVTTENRMVVVTTLAIVSDDTTISTLTLARLGMQFFNFIFLNMDISVSHIQFSLHFVDN